MHYPPHRHLHRTRHHPASAHTPHIAPHVPTSGHHRSSERSVPLSAGANPLEESPADLLNDQQLHGRSPPPLAQMKVDAAQVGLVQESSLAAASLTIAYHFTVGSDRIPHLYEAVRGPDGQVSGQAYVLDAKGDKTAADMPKFQTDMLQTFAAEDIAAGHGGHDLGLSRLQQNRMADKHASTLLALESARQGAAKQKEVEQMMVSDPNLVAGWIEGHREDARKLLDNPNYMAIAEKYRLEHPDTRLSDALGTIGVISGTTTRIASTSRSSTQPAF